MAISGNNPYIAEYDSNFLQTYDTPIGGKLLVAEISCPEMDTMSLSEDEIKKRLVSILAKGILSSEYALFTRAKDPYTFREVFKARCYLAPSDQVKILRQVVK